MRPDERSGWQESGLIESLQERFEMPVTSYQAN
jgi:hypothetical protein